MVDPLGRIPLQAVATDPWLLGCAPPTPAEFSLGSHDAPAEHAEPATPAVPMAAAGPVAVAGPLPAVLDRPAAAAAPAARDMLGGVSGAGPVAVAGPVALLPVPGCPAGGTQRGQKGVSEGVCERGNGGGSLALGGGVSDGAGPRKRHGDDPEDWGVQEDDLGASSAESSYSSTSLCSPSQYFWLDYGCEFDLEMALTESKAEAGSRPPEGHSLDGPSGALEGPRKCGPANLPPSQTPFGSVGVQSQGSPGTPKRARGGVQKVSQGGRFGPQNSPRFGSQISPHLGPDFDPHFGPQIASEDVDRQGGPQPVGLSLGDAVFGEGSTLKPPEKGRLGARLARKFSSLLTRAKTRKQ